ncbi:MAG: hypothetical protein NTX50_12645 [Candidatus Sumerlaeota bacterium]|nr:hypothetical protein [Candidatus Sumerlaeota bacterium]
MNAAKNHVMPAFGKAPGECEGAMPGASLGEVVVQDKKAQRRYSIRKKTIEKNRIRLCWPQ